jgi:hypothetical protein
MTAGSDPGRRRGVLASVAAIAILVGVPAIAAADPSALELFKEGRALVKQGKHGEACEKFKKSQELDPQIGTLFNIAQCEEKTGKLASALAAYREVVAKDTNAERKALAAEYQSKHEPRVPKIVVQIEKPPVNLVVTLDGSTGAKPIDANLPNAVDLGDYTVIARADGYRELSTKVHIATEGDTTTVPISLALVHSENNVVVSHNVPAEPAPEPERSHSHRKRYGYIGMGVGGAAIATGVVFGVIASGKWSDAKAVCGGTICPTQMQVDQANALVSDARSAGNLSTGFVVAGGVLATAGLLLWVTAPTDEHALQVTPTPTPSSTGLALSGRF